MKENGLTINEKVKRIHSMCNNKLILLKASVMAISISLLAVSIFAHYNFNSAHCNFNSAHG